MHDLRIIDQWADPMVLALVQHHFNISVCAETNYRPFSMMMGSFDDLVCHRFGRYPVQCLVFTGDYRLEVVALLSQDLPRYVTFRSSCRVIETAMEVGCTDDFVLAVRRAVADAPKSPTRSQKTKQHANI